MFFWKTYVFLFDDLWVFDSTYLSIHLTIYLLNFLITGRQVNLSLKYSVPWCVAISCLIELPRRITMTPHVEKEKYQKNTSLKSNMEPKNHPIEKENHLPNLHLLGFQPLIFLFFLVYTCLGCGSKKRTPITQISLRFCLLFRVNLAVLYLPSLDIQIPLEVPCFRYVFGAQIPSQEVAMDV